MASDPGKPLRIAPHVRSMISAAAQAKPVQVTQPLAPHVQAVIGSSAQPKAANSPLCGAKIPAPHVQNATAIAQAKLAQATTPRFAPAPHKASPKKPEAPAHGAIQPAAGPAPPRPAATPRKSATHRDGVAQLTTYKSVGVDRDYVVTPSSRGSKSYLVVTEPGESEVLANMRYEIVGRIAYMEHVEAYGMPQGTRTGYLLFYVFAKHAQREGVTTIAIGTGVDERSANRNLAQGRDDLKSAKTDEERLEAQNLIDESNRNLAAVHIYSELGFDASDAVKLSNSNLAVGDVIRACVSKLDNRWLKKIQEKSKCFLTTACVVSHGLPDDCEELEILRHFRDGYLAASEHGPAMIKHYEIVAPRILEALADHQDATSTLKHIYQVIRCCVDDIRASRPAVALDRYQALVTDLTETYLR